MNKEVQTKTEKTAIALRWGFNVMVTAAIAFLFGSLGWMLSLFILVMANNELSRTIISIGIPCLFGIIGAMLGARTLLTHI